MTDIEAVLKRRYDNGADYWATPDKNLIKGSPFTTLGSVMLLFEMGLDLRDPIFKKTGELILSCMKPDGRFRLSPKGTIYPCHTINALNVLCSIGYAGEPVVKKSFDHLMGIMYKDGGFRCNKFSFGRGPLTEFSNPGPTLTALNAFRYTEQINPDKDLDRTVEFLLEHWVIRKPIGPCMYGIGSLFMQVEYPFLTYNIFNYVYVLSFYEKAVKDERFKAAFQYLKSRLMDDMIVVERVNSQLQDLEFCRKGKKSIYATKRYKEILKNL